MPAKEHWETIYTVKSPTEVSWYQREAEMSLRLIEQVAPGRTAAVIDVGGGASTLVDTLLDHGYERPTVLDIAASGLAHAQARLGARAGAVQWLCGDVLEAELPEHGFDVWHDRAVFHFLVAEDDRKRYVAQVARAVRPGGHVIMATFAEDGPKKCSGLEVMRYDAAGLHSEFGSQFELLSSAREEHHTPSGGSQAFQYCVCAFRRND